MATKVLLVEDERPLAELVRDYLADKGFDVEIELHGNRAVQRILSENPEIVVLDLMLPGEDGLSICKRVRPKYRGLILMLTARGEPEAEVTGLDIGADDYLAKPVNPRVLLSRMRALLRRSAPQEDPATTGKITAGALEMISSSRQARMRGEPLELSSAEFDLLWLLASQAGTVLSRQAILDRMRGTEYDGIDRTIDVRISKLRQKIGDDPKRPEIIKTIRGVGYIYAV